VGVADLSKEVTTEVRTCVDCMGLRTHESYSLYQEGEEPGIYWMCRWCGLRTLRWGITSKRPWKDFMRKLFNREGGQIGEAE